MTEMAPEDPCEHFTTGEGTCGSTPTRRFLPGFRCGDHTPARLAGRPNVAHGPKMPRRLPVGPRRPTAPTTTTPAPELPRDWRTVEAPTPPRSTSSAAPPFSKPRFFTQADVNLARVHQAEREVGHILEAQRLARIAARDGTR